MVKLKRLKMITMESKKFYHINFYPMRSKIELFRIKIYYQI